MKNKKGADRIVRPKRACKKDPAQGAAAKL
jgi:hypothetical protein